MRTTTLGGGLFGLQVLALLGAVTPPQDTARSAPADDVADAGPAAPVDAQVAASVVAILTPPADGEAPDPALMVEAIRELGNPVIPVLVAMLAGELEVPVIVPDSTDLPVHPQALAQRAEVLPAALAGLPVEAVLAHLSERLRAKPAAEVGLMIAAMLGEIDELAACELLVELVEGLDPLQLRRRYVQATLESALAAHFRRDPSSLDLVWRSGMDSPAERLTLYARALGAARTARGMELLASWLDRIPEANGEILKQLAGADGLAVSSEVLAAVRSQFHATDLDARRSALVAAGRLRDETAFENLVSMLVGEPELVTASARWSLRTICGMDLGAEPQDWLDWREREQTWFTERVPVLLVDLDSEIPGVVLQAVGELVQHPFHRHALAETLGPLTEHADPDVARGACIAVGRLESHRSVPWMMAALKSSDPALRNSAAEALQRLTGLDLPPEHEAWKNALRAG